MERFIVLKDIKTNDEISTNERWSLILSNKENTPPSPKTSYISIPGGDGSLDLTEANGEVKYEDRNIKYTFSLMNNFSELPTVISDIANVIHGKKFKVFHWDDLDYYYVARLTINSYTISKAKGTFEINAICEPYKYKKYPTKYEYDIVGSKTIICPNLKKRVVPIITVDNEMSIEFQGDTYTVSSGSHQILGIYFDSGIYELLVTGNGHFKIEYQEASL